MRGVFEKRKFKKKIKEIWFYLILWGVILRGSFKKKFKKKGEDVWF
jgi:hypothetical protein